MFLHTIFGNLSSEILCCFSTHAILCDWHLCVSCFFFTSIFTYFFFAYKRIWNDLYVVTVSCVQTERAHILALRFNISWYLHTHTYYINTKRKHVFICIEAFCINDGHNLKTILLPSANLSKLKPALLKLLFWLLFCYEFPTKTGIHWKIVILWLA